MPDHEPNDDGKIDEPSEDELELEPIDPEVLEHRRQRVKSRTRELEDRADIDELLEPAERTDPITLDEFKKFRFNIRHLLSATALLALAMTVGDRFGACTGLFAGAGLLLAAGWWVVTQKERAQRVQRDQRRLEMERRLAAQRAAEDGKPGESAQAPVEPREPVVPAPRPPISFSFSLKQLLATFTIAAVALGLTHRLGEANTAALLLGFVALAGLLVHALGFDPPPVVILCWWLTLVLYILTGILAALTANDETALQPHKRLQQPPGGQPSRLVGVDFVDPGVHARFQHVEWHRSSG